MSLKYGFVYEIQIYGEKMKQPLIRGQELDQKASKSFQSNDSNPIESVRLANNSAVTFHDNRCQVTFDLPTYFTELAKNAEGHGLSLNSFVKETIRKCVDTNHIRIEASYSSVTLDFNKETMRTFFESDINALTKQLDDALKVGLEKKSQDLIEILAQRFPKSRKASPSNGVAKMV
jgi:hypothetical protein